VKAKRKDQFQDMTHSSLSRLISLTGFILMLAIASLEAATHYVSTASQNPMSPYTNWATAAANIQAAVNVAAPRDVVLVTNGVYPGVVTITNPLALLSVSGPQFTILDGEQSTDKFGNGIPCVSLVDGASLTGFTLTNGLGGGVSCSSTNAFVTNCLIAGNALRTGLGAGASSCTLFNCTLTGNSGGDGGGAANCTLYDCTLSGNTAWGGGGAFSSALYNCTLSNNSAIDTDTGPCGGCAFCILGSPSAGGGALSCTLYNCTLISNSTSACGYEGSTSDGGAAANCVLYNSTLIGNSGDAANGCTLYNCTLSSNPGYGADSNSALYNCICYFNSGPDESNYDGTSTLDYCCTTPLPISGVGNITAPPLFVDYTTGNFRLQSNSPCINAGNLAYAMTTTDIDGNSRIVSGAVDIGAYEYQGLGSAISYAWLDQYGLPTDGSVDRTDLDSSGMTVYQDWVAGLNPTNALSVLAMLPLARKNNPAGFVINWKSVANISYFLQRSTNLVSQPAFTTLATNIAGHAGTTSYTDTNADGAGPFFYRVGVQSP